MFSIKDAVRKTVVAVSLAALTTSFFTGCSQQPTVSDVDLYPPSITTEVSTPYTEELTDDINPGINDETHDANTFSIKYKYWYDNPDVKETQDKALAEADPGGDNPNGETFLGIPGLPLYTDPSGNQYIISGRTVCYLADGKLASKDMYNLLRKTGTGERIYYGLTQTAEDILSTFLKRSAGKEQPATYEDRKAQDTEATLNSVTYAIYVNNIETGMTTTPDGMIEVSSVLPGYGVANYALDEQALYLHTAAVSNLKLEFKTEADTITIEYSTGEKDENISTKEIILAGDMLKMSPEAVEHYLGYDIEVYDDFINIVTDNKDIITPDSILPAEAESLADSTLNDKDTTKPIEQTHTTESQPEPAHTEEVVTVIPSEPSTPPVSASKSDNDKIPGSDLTYGQFREIYGYDVPDNAYDITDKGYKDTQGGFTYSPAEAARWNQTVKDIMDGKEKSDWGEGLSHEEIIEPW